jgi:hypothetical protein
MIDRNRCLRRQLGFCVGWRAAVAELPTAVDIARRLADALAKEGMRYAIGGALALAYYAPPRATVDVDINVFVSPSDGLTQLLSVLGAAGFAADSPETVTRTKMMFFRRKDVADVEAVLRHPPPGLDVESIRDRLVEMVGEDDERATEWDSIIRDVREAK